MADTTASRGDYLLLGLASLSYACLTFVWFSVAAFLPVLTTDLGLSGTDAGLLTGIVPLVYVPFSLASGLAIDRIGAPRAIAAGLLLFGLAQLARGFAPGFPTLLALTGLVGLGGTAITFGLPKLLAERFTPTRSGTLSSVYLLGSCLGIAAAFGLGRAILGPCSGAGGRSFAGAGSRYSPSRSSGSKLPDGFPAGTITTPTGETGERGWNAPRARRTKPTGGLNSKPELLPTPRVRKPEPSSDRSQRT